MVKGIHRHPIKNALLRNLVFNQHTRLQNEALTLMNESRRRYIVDIGRVDESLLTGVTNGMPRLLHPDNISTICRFG